MGSTRSGGGPDDLGTGTWTTETLPLSVRKELLERELSSLGFRKKEAHGGGSAPQQQQPHGDGHPQADAAGADHGG
jgi:hypothetical protein